MLSTFTPFSYKWNISCVISLTSADKITFVNNPESSVEDTHKEINLAEIFTEDAVISSAGVEANTSDILPEGADIDANLTEIKTDNEYEGEKKIINGVYCKVVFNTYEAINPIPPVVEYEESELKELDQI